MNIKKDGNYILNAGHSMSKSVVYISGIMGGATLTLQVFGIPLVDGVITSGIQYEVHHGVDVTLEAVITGSTGMDADIHCVGIH